MSLPAAPMPSCHCFTALGRCLSLALLLSLGCTGDPGRPKAPDGQPAPAPRVETEKQGLQLSIEKRNGAYAARFLKTLGTGPASPVLSIEGVRLRSITRGGEAEEARLPFRRFHPISVEGRSGFELSSENRLDHRIRLRLLQKEERGDESAWTIEVLDEIGLRSQVLDLSLELRAEEEGLRPWLPAWLPDSLDLLGDSAWFCPMAALSGPSGITVLRPVLLDRAEDRRMPAYLGSLPAGNGRGPALLAGFSRYGYREKGRPSLQSVQPIPLEEEELSLRLVLGFHPAGKLEAALAMESEALWAEGGRVASREHRASGGMRDLGDEAVLSALAIASQRVHGFGARGRSLLCPPSVDPAKGPVLLRSEDVDHCLDLALGLEIWGKRSRNGSWRQKGAGLARLFLSAPSTSGLFPTQVIIRDGRANWTLGPERAFESRACARTALDLLRYGEENEALFAACLGRARALAELFLRNQLADGSFPVRFDEEFVPIRGSSFRASSDALGIARLLLAVEKHTKNKALLSAAKRVFDHLTTTWEERPSVNERTLIELGYGKNKPVRGQQPITTHSVLQGTLLALELSKRSESKESRDEAVRWMHRLLPLQQVWTPPFSSALLRGGLCRSNFETSWSDLDAIEAVSAFIEGHRLTKRASYLDRAREAYLAPFRVRGARSYGIDERDAAEFGQGVLPGLATISGTLGRLRNRYGHVAFDPETGDCLCLGPFQASFERTASGTSEIRVAAVARPGSKPVVAVLRTLHPTKRAMPLVLNGRELGLVQPSTLSRGIPLLAHAADRLELHLPKRHPRYLDLELRAVLSIGVAAPAARVEARVTLANEEYRFALERKKGKSDGIFKAVIRAARFAGTAKSLRVQVEASGLPFDRVPKGRLQSRTVSVELSDHGLLDFGDDDERYAIAARALRVVPSPDGRGHARVLEKGQVLELRVPAPAESLRTRLRLRYAGQLKVQVAHLPEQELRSPEKTPFALREWTLRRRRAWEDGWLHVTITGGVDGAKLSALAFESVGFATPAPRIADPIDLRPSTGEHLRLLAVPIEVDGAGQADRERIRISLFADPEIDSTSMSGLRPSRSSLAAWIDELSEGSVALEGKVLRAATLAGTALPREAKNREAQMAVVRTLLECSAIERKDLIDSDILLFLLKRKRPIATVLDFGVADLPSEFLPDALPGRQMPTKAIVLDLASDAVSQTELARTFFRTLRRAGGQRGEEPPGLEKLTLAGADAKSKDTPLPLGMHLHELGWLPRYVVREESHRRVTVPSLGQGSYLLTLPIQGLPGRGVVHLERRPPSDSNAWSSGGLLGYWDFAGGTAPILPGRERASGYRFLGLFTEPSTWARRAEAKSRPLSGSRIPIVTPQGELVWTLQRLSDDGERAQLDLSLEGQSLLEGSLLRSASKKRGSEVFVARMLKREAGKPFEIEIEDETLRLVYSPRELRNGARLSLLLASAQGTKTAVPLHATVSIRSFSRRSKLFDQDIELGATSVPLLVTIPPTLSASRSIEVDLRPLHRGPQKLRLLAARLFALQDPILDLFALAPANRVLPGTSQRLGDGAYHGPLIQLDPSQEGRMEFPVSLPESAAVLRFELGSPLRAKDKLETRVLFRSTKGEDPILLEAWTPYAKRKGALALHVFDTSRLRSRAGFLSLETRGTARSVFLTLASIRKR